MPPLRTPPLAHAIFIHASPIAYFSFVVVTKLPWYDATCQEPATEPCSAIWTIEHSGWKGMVQA